MKNNGTVYAHVLFARSGVDIDAPPEEIPPDSVFFKTHSKHPCAGAPHCICWRLQLPCISTVHAAHEFYCLTKAPVASGTYQLWTVGAFHAAHEVVVTICVLQLSPECSMCVQLYYSVALTDSACGASQVAYGLVASCQL